MDILARTNDALNINPPEGDQYLSENGSNWLWAVTAVYAISFIGVLCLSFAARSGEKIFHYLFTIALLVGTIAYFAMASDLGWSLVPTANSISHGATRQIFFAKYINWVVTFPVVTIALGLLSGISWATIAYNVFLTWIWIISYLCSAYTMTNYKWGFFAFGTVAMALVVFGTVIEGAAAAKRVGVSRHHSLLSCWPNLLWNTYAVAFGLSDGGNDIGVTAGFIFFGIIDILMMPLFAFVFLFLSRSWDYGKLNIAFTQYGRVRQDGTFPRKDAAPHVGPIVTAV
jgi:bacteriorhodopsin